MTCSLQCCRNQQVDRKNRAAAQGAVHLDGAVMRFNDGFCKWQAQPDALCILGEAAAVKTFEDVRQVLRMDAAAAVPHRDLNDRRKGAPCDRDRVACLGVVERVFDQIADGFSQPVRIAGQGNIVLPGIGQHSILLLRLHGKAPLDLRHQVGQVVFGFVQHDCTRVQFGDGQQVVHQRLNTVKLLLGQGGKFPNGVRVGLLLQNAVVDIERRQRGLELVRDVGQGIFHKTFGTAFIFGVGIQDCGQRVDLVEQAVEFALVVAFDARGGVTREKRMQLLNCARHGLVLLVKIAVHDGQHQKPHAGERRREIPCGVLTVCGEQHGRQQGKPNRQGQDKAKQAFDVPISQHFHGAPHFAAFHL